MSRLFRGNFGGIDVWCVNMRVCELCFIGVRETSNTAPERAISDGE